MGARRARNRTETDGATDIAHASPWYGTTDWRTVAASFAGLIAKALAAEIDSLGAEARREGDGFYTARTSPLARRTFLASARAGLFPSFRVGRRIYARRTDVHDFIESRRRPLAAPDVMGESDEIGALLDAAGITRSRSS
jgi:hypothetical protein